MHQLARRAANRICVIGLAVAITALASFAAPSDTRTISFYHIHTGETLTVTYKKNGVYVPEALAKINWIMRDWRKNLSIPIDPKTIDIIWEMHEELGSREPVNIICGYRSRDTNEMLRRTVGGQASQSQHITGKAVDISFPDIPVRQMRYSAMIRERGGVGYYPTSAIPFVHVDSARVRHWPRMPRDELALLFPSGHSKHEPADGRPITPADVAAARARNKDIAREVAAFFDVRSKPKSAVLVADASGARPLSAPAPLPVSRPAKPPAQRMSVGAPPPDQVALLTDAAPKLVSAPHQIERHAQLAAYPSDDRSRLDKLVTLASLESSQIDVPQTFGRKESETRGKPIAPKRPVLAGAMTGIVSGSPAVKAPGEEVRVAALESAVTDRAPVRAAEIDASPSGWIAAPAYDDDHPEELTYRPFPLAPLLTASASPDDPTLATMVHPDIAETLEVLDDDGSILPMRLRPGRQTAGLMWAQEFRGEAVNVAELGATGEPARPGPLAERSVRTTSR